MPDETSPGGKEPVTRTGINKAMEPAVSSTASDPPPPRPFGEASFDLWLRRELSRLYDDALHEPVPEELLRLLEQGSRRKS